MNPQNSFLNMVNIQNARKALKVEGAFVIENAYSQDLCKAMIKLIDDHEPDDKTEMNYAGTELRIWDAQKRGPLFDSFYQRCNVFISCLLLRDTEAFTLLAMRNKALEPDDAVSKKGRWHLDSVRKQLKIFLFLTETTELSGPFEFIPGTHLKSYKARMLLNGSYFRVGNLFNGKRAYSRLDDDWISELPANPVPIICKAGTVMVLDSTAIHRARPCLQGQRYALTAYYR